MIIYIPNQSRDERALKNLRIQLPVSEKEASGIEVTVNLMEHLLKPFLQISYHFLAKNQIEFQDILVTA